MTVEGMGGVRRGLGSGLAIPTSKVRRVYFSFHYQRDIWQVQQVRNHWVTKADRQAAGYFDGSLAEKAKTDGSPAVKRLINDGMVGTSVTCVLVGSETYQRYWVDYEIFRTIEFGKGLFAVRINGLKDKTGATDGAGPNPFDFLSYRSNSEGKLVPHANYKDGWRPYADGNVISSGAAPYLRAGGVPSLLTLGIAPNPITALSPALATLFPIYDWVLHNGFANFSAWVDKAAEHASRK